MKKLTTLLALAFIGFASYAQEEESMVLKDSSYLSKSQYPSQYDYENFRQAFAPKKKNKWSLGVSGGLSGIMGEINPKLSWGASIYGQKALGHVFSLRLQAMYADVKGIDDRKTAYDGTFRNYHGYVGDLSLQGVFTLNNINFYKKDPKFILYGLFGAGASMHDAKFDLTDASGITYDYSAYANPNTLDEKKVLMDNLNNLLDGTYETKYTEVPGADLLRIRKVVPSVTVGAGLAYKLNKTLDLALENRLSWHQTDYLDGYNVNKAGLNAEGADLLNFLSLALRVRLGSGLDADWWVNPLYNTMEDMRMLKEKAAQQDVVADADNDGVDDMLDKDLNTPPGVVVNTHGVTMDIDRDGVADNYDKELFSPDGSKVDRNGISVDSDKDGVADVLDKELNSPAHALVDAKGIDITEGVPAVSSTASDDFGVVFFDYNSSLVKHEFFPQVYKVADYMKVNPSVKIKVTGHADNRANDAYNQALALKRAQNVIELLIKGFGFDKSRFTAVSSGEKDPFVPGLPDKRDGKTTESLQYLNRRVTFSVSN